MVWCGGIMATYLKSLHQQDYFPRVRITFHMRISAEKIAHPNYFSELSDIP